MSNAEAARSQDGTADFGRMASGWQRAAMVLSPVSDEIVRRLGPVDPASVVLDVACGAGEPGLSLRERQPDIELTGIDLSSEMLAQARALAGRSGTRFEVGDAASLPLDDDSADVVVSRFGLLWLRQQNEQAVAEAHRVLRRGGMLSLATWDRTEFNALFAVQLDVLATIAPHADQRPDFVWMDDLVTPGRREEWLRLAGFVDVESLPFVWSMPLGSIDDFWSGAVTNGLFAPRFRALDPAAERRARALLAHRLDRYRTADGSYAVPHLCRVVTARKPIQGEPA